MRSPLVLVLSLTVALLGGGFVHFWWTSIRMPGESFQGQLTAFTDEEQQLAKVLEQDVRHLTEQIGERNLQRYAALETAANWIDATVSALGYAVARHSYTVEGKAVHNLEAIVPGDSSDANMIVIGAHYDSAHGTAGANDNGSGVAALLELARRFSGQNFLREVRLVWFTNEEPPHFQTDDMGSLHYARGLQASGRTVIAMLSLETIGYYSDARDTQLYPGVMQGFYPDQGNFIAYVSNPASRGLVHEALGLFRQRVQFPSEGAALPESIPGIGWSDHWSFWKIGAPALMLTDTALFRYPHYHRASDTADKLDYPRLGRVTMGIAEVVAALANE